MICSKYLMKWLKPTLWDLYYNFTNRKHLFIPVMYFQRKVNSCCYSYHTTCVIIPFNVFLHNKIVEKINRSAESETIFLMLRTEIIQFFMTCNAQYFTSSEFKLFLLQTNAYSIVTKLKRCISHFEVPITIVKHL